MPYSAVVVRLLVSCPSDIPDSDLELIHRTVNRWNTTYGEQFQRQASPVSWGQNAAAVFGEAPQEAINRQIVDYADMGLALFANRLGTKTTKAESGSVEEIEKLIDAGKPVAVLRCRREVKTADLDTKQLSALDAWIKKNSHRALFLSYEDDRELVEHVNNILAANMQSASFGHPSVRASSVLREPADVWPDIRKESYVLADRNGRESRKIDRYLTLKNNGGTPALNVTFDVTPIGGEVRHPSDNDDEVGFQLMTEVPTIEALAPGGSIEFALLMHMQSAGAGVCEVRWEDATGTSYSNRSTIKWV